VNPSSNLVQITTPELCITSLMYDASNTAKRMGESTRGPNELCLRRQQPRHERDNALRKDDEFRTLLPLSLLSRKGVH